MSAPYVLGHLVPSVVGSWGLVFTLVAVAAVLTVAGLVLLLRSRRRTPGGHR